MARPDLGAVGFRPPLITAGALCIAAAVGIVLFVRESRRPGVSAGPKSNPLAALREALRHPVIAQAFGTIFLGFFAGSAMWSVLGLWGEATFGWGPRQVGLVMAGTGVAAAASQGLFAGMLVRRIGAGATIAGGMTLCGVCYLAMAAAPWGVVAGVLLVASVAGHALWQPAATSIVAQSSPPDRQGAILGAGSASGSLARVAGPAVGGVLFSTIAPWAPIVFSAIFMLPAAWLGWRAARALRVALENPPQQV
jgi:MFS transporter, DHA1 family, tetracycline resistance protein